MTDRQTSNRQTDLRWHKTFERRLKSRVDWVLGARAASPSRPGSLRKCYKLHRSFFGVYYCSISLGTDNKNNNNKTEKQKQKRKQLINNNNRLTCLNVRFSVYKRSRGFISRRHAMILILLCLEQNKWWWWWWYCYWVVFIYCSA